MKGRMGNLAYLILTAGAGILFWKVLFPSMDWLTAISSAAVIVFIGFVFFVLLPRKALGRLPKLPEGWRARRMPATLKEKIYFFIGVSVSGVASVGVLFLISGFLVGIGIRWLAAFLFFLIFFGILITGSALTIRILGLSKQKKRSDDTKKDREQDSWFY